MRRLSVRQWSMVAVVSVLLVGSFVVLGLRDAGIPTEDARDGVEPATTPTPTSLPAASTTPTTPRPA